MPSWYALYFTVIGAYFLAAATGDTSARGWLFSGGSRRGLSICCKFTGVWYVLAVLVYLGTALRTRSRKTRAGLVRRRAP